MSRSFSAPSFESAAVVARLDIPEYRAEPVRSAVESAYGLIDKLDDLDLDLAETPPGTAFDARWE